MWANVYVREQEGAKSGGRLTTPLCFLILPHASLPLFALASVSVTDCHVCVHNARVCSLPLRMSVHARKGTAGKAESAVGLCLHMPRTDRKKVKKTYKKGVKPTREKV